VASVVFFGGCDFRCPFCHNPELVIPDKVKKLPTVDFPVARSEIEKRRKLITGVVVSGGEPTIYRDIASFLEEIKGQGLKVKIDTNGSMPDVLSGLLDRELVDMVALDIKTAPAQYPLATGGRSFGPVGESLDLLMKRGRGYILRTTVVPGLVGLKEVEEIASLVVGAVEYHLQSFRGEVTLDPAFEGLAPVSPDMMERMAQILDEAVKRVVKLW
jgi:pyruvate formate lyase activating enzyme